MGIDMRSVLFDGWKSTAVRMVFSITFSLAVIFSKKIVFLGRTLCHFDEVIFNNFSVKDLLLLLLCGCVVYAASAVACAILNYYLKTHVELPRRHSMRFCVCVFGLLLLIWLPCLLTYYPGGIYSDTATSVWMATGEYPLNNHHPILYTMIWRAVFAVGGIFHLSFEGAFFIFTWLMAICMALAVTYFIYSCYLHGISRILLIFVVFFYALYTLVPLYIVSLWKDTPFSIAVFALSTVLMNIFWDSESEMALLEKRNMIPLIVFGGASSFLRNNGIYVFAMLAVVIFVYLFRKKRILAAKAGGIFLAAIAAMYIIRFPVFDRLGWNVDEKVESLGIPLQQIGYILNSSDSLTDRQIRFLNEIMPVETWKQEYTPLIIDNIKWSQDFHKGYFDTHIKSFIQVYGELVIKNPVDAIKAYALATVGFWDPTRQVSIAYVNNFMWNGLTWEMKDIPEMYLGFSLKDFYDTQFRPSTALYGWTILFFLTIGLCTKKKRRIIIPMVPVLGIWLTLMLAVPVAYSLRYLFPAVLVVPMAFVMMIHDEGRKSVSDREEDELCCLVQ